MSYNMTTLTTTLRLLRQHDACTNRYPHLRSALGPHYSHDRPITLLQILDLNGLDDALWALRAVPAEQEQERDRFARVLACDYAEHVLPIFEALCPHDSRPREAIAVARRFAAAEASREELDAAESAARSAWSAAESAARSAWFAAESAARSAWSAAESAARAAWSAAESAAESAWFAAEYAAESAWYAEYAAESAWYAERAWQEARLREILS